MIRLLQTSGDKSPTTNVNANFGRWIAYYKRWRILSLLSLSMALKTGVISLLMTRVLFQSSGWEWDKINRICSWGFGIIRGFNAILV